MPDSEYRCTAAPNVIAHNTTKEGEKEDVDGEVEAVVLTREKERKKVVTRKDDDDDEEEEEGKEKGCSR